MSSMRLPPKRSISSSIDTCTQSELKTSFDVDSANYLRQGAFDGHAAHVEPRRHHARAGLWRTVTRGPLLMRLQLLSTSSTGRGTCLSVSVRDENTHQIKSSHSGLCAVLHVRCEV